MPATRMPPSERAALRTMAWSVAGCAAAVPLLAVPVPGDPLILVTVHLAALVAFGAALALALAPLTDEEWFTGIGRSFRVRTGMAGVWIIVLVTGSVGIVTLATSAALRYDPSLQFLQALSALDIAWAAAALVVGLRWWRGQIAALSGAVMMGVVCVWSIWHYLSVVGFGPSGEWVVDASRMMTLILPYDVMAAVAAVTVFFVGLRARDRVSAG